MIRILKKGNVEEAWQIRHREIMMEEGIRKTLALLEARNLNALFAKDCKEARQLILNLIPQEAVVGIGDSSTVRQINVIIVNEDLGLGWDRSWPKRRVNGIAARHERYMWTIPKAARETLNLKDVWKTVRTTEQDIQTGNRKGKK